MNQVSLKIYNTHNTDTGFQGSSQTSTNKIMVILAEKKHKLKPSINLSPSDESDPDTKKQVKLSTFAHYFNQTGDPDSSKYKVNKKTIWNSVAYYFCDFPTKNL